MKFLRLAVAAVFATTFGSAYAFHSGGVAECEGCHSMHNSFEGAANVTGSTTGQGSGPYLLKAQTQSGACLNCHNSADTVGSGYHISTDGSMLHFTAQGATAGNYSGPVEVTPGGDFAWLKSTRTGSIRGALTTWLGERQGHNVIAPDFSYGVDGTQVVAPGGTYPAANLHCSSCHDPHGKYRRFADGTVGVTGAPIFNSGSYTTSKAPISGVAAVGVYRLLAGVGYQPKSLTGSYGFLSPSPDALSPSSYNNAASNTTIAGTQDRVAYGQGMSEWCANCHVAFIQGSYTSGMGGLRHPAGNGAKLTAAIVANYNAYISSGIAGTPPNAGYSALAPFETGMTDRTPASYAALATFQGTPTAAATTNNVACVSCHRAHATAFESMTRFYTGNEFMTVADSSNAPIYDSTATENKINTGYAATTQAIAYNGRPATLFGPYARDYCNKCHNKD
jgi:hypothetical protein